MRDNAPSTELCEKLKELYGLAFTPIPFIEKRDLGALLRANKVKTGPWLDRVWEEYRAHDSILAHDGAGTAYRFIRTVTIAIRRTRRIRGRIFDEYLKERIEWPDGRTRERAYGNSMSEKVKWRKDFTWRTRFNGWHSQVIRALYEELGVPLTVSILKRCLTRIGPAGGIAEKKGRDPSRPGITTWNLLLKSRCRLPRRFWKPEYREERRDENGQLIKTMVHTWAREKD